MILDHKSSEYEGHDPNTNRPREVRLLEPALKRERIYWIAGRMALGEWRSKRDHHEKVAGEWGVTIQTVRDYAAEASRLVQWSSHDLEQLELWCRQRLHQIAGEDHGDRVQAIKLLLQNIGKLTERHQHDVTLSDDPNMVIQRACRSMVRDPEAREILVDQLRIHAPELLAPELRIVNTTGRELPESTGGNNE